MEEKKLFLLTRKSVFTSRKLSKIGFPLWFPLAKKPPNKRILFQVNKKFVSTSRNEEFV